MLESQFAAFNQTASSPSAFVLPETLILTVRIAFTTLDTTTKKKQCQPNGFDEKESEKAPPVPEEDDPAVSLAAPTKGGWPVPDLRWQARQEGGEEQALPEAPQSSTPAHARPAGH